MFLAADRRKWTGGGRDSNPRPPGPQLGARRHCTSLGVISSRFRWCSITSASRGSGTVVATELPSASPATAWSTPLSLWSGGSCNWTPRARARWSRLRAPEHPLERRRHPRVRRCRARCSPPTTRPARSAITYALKSAWATSTSLVTASARRAIQYFSRQTGRLLEPGGFAGARGPDPREGRHGSTRRFSPCGSRTSRGVFTRRSNRSCSPNAD